MFKGKEITLQKYIKMWVISIKFTTPRQNRMNDVVLCHFIQKINKIINTELNIVVFANKCKFISSQKARIIIYVLINIA